MEHFIIAIVVVVVEAKMHVPSVSFVCVLITCDRAGCSSHF
jgi:hypothetical protein